MTEQEALKYFNNANRTNNMLCILPKSDIGKCIIKALEEIQQYRAIGTPEECRAAVEKQTAKKVKIEQWIYTKCDCGYEFSTHHGDGYYSIPYERKTKYCPDCGQKLDWGDVE